MNKNKFNIVKNDKDSSIRYAESSYAISLTIVDAVMSSSAGIAEFAIKDGLS